MAGWQDHGTVKGHKVKSTYQTGNDTLAKSQGRGLVNLKARRIVESVTGVRTSLPSEEQG